MTPNPMSRHIVHALLVVLLFMFTLSAASARDLPAERTLYVAANQDVEELIRTLYPEHPRQWEAILEWIVEENAEAFGSGGPDSLRGDVRLRIPGQRELVQLAVDPGAQQPDSPADGGADADTALVFGERYLFVNPAQSIRNLVSRVYDDHEPLWDRIVDAIMARNEDRLAELASDDTVSRGTRLQIPEVVAAERAVESEANGDAQELEASVGVFGRVVGDVRVEDRYNRERTARAGSVVHPGDRISTAANARAGIELDDGERIRLRPDSRIRVRDWALPDVGAGTRVVELLEGGMRAITGAIGNRSDDDYRTITSNATMGIRGTDYSVRLCAADDCVLGEADGHAPAGLYVATHRGGVEVLNAGGELALDAGEFSRIVDDRTAPQRIAPAEADFLLADAGDDEPTIPATEPAVDADDETSSGWLWGVGALILIGLAL